MGSLLHPSDFPSWAQIASRHYCPMSQRRRVRPRRAAACPGLRSCWALYAQLLRLCCRFLGTQSPVGELELSPFWMSVWSPGQRLTINCLPPRPLCSAPRSRCALHDRAPCPPRASLSKCVSVEGEKAWALSWEVGTPQARAVWSFIHQERLSPWFWLGSVLGPGAGT